MPHHVDSAGAEVGPRLPWWRVAAEILLILLVFAIHAGWPVPDDNEAHYLTKAKHYWTPDWGAGDFFLESADAHQTFYWVFGWLSLYLPLPALAWAGRFLTWGLLAAGWQRLSWTVIPRPWISVLSASLFAVLNEKAHMAGEWVIGGVEAKGFAYALVFFALATVAQARWNRAWILLGSASALHVLVGGWAAIAAGVAWLADGRSRSPIHAMLPGLAAGLGLALLGLWPALALTADVSSSTVHEANQIYVYKRLPHHLVHSTFRIGFIGRHVLLSVLFLALCSFTPADDRQRRLRWCVGAAIGIAAIGFLIAAAAEHIEVESVRLFLTGLLRYYWFRLSDAMVPLGVALIGMTSMRHLVRRSPTVAGLWLAGAVAASAMYLTTRFFEAPLAETPRGDKNVVYADWLDVCRWINESAPADAVLLGPRLASSLTFYTGRPEVANWKNIPQDAPGIVEWWRRINDIHARKPESPADPWYDSLAEMGPDALQSVAAQYAVRYAIVDKRPEVPALPWTPSYENTSYAVYDLSRIAAENASQ